MNYSRYDWLDIGWDSVPHEEVREFRNLQEELRLCCDEIFYLTLKLAMLIDEAGHWRGPYLDGLLDDDDKATRQYDRITRTLEKILSE